MLFRSARKYISENKPKLAKAEGDAADKLRSKMQQRVQVLVSAGQSFDPDYKSELESLGLVFEL